MARLPEALNVDSLTTPQQAATKELPMLTEWAFDFETHQFDLDENGLPYMVRGNEALKIWIYWAVTTAKGRWGANSNGYGSEVERMVGLPISVAIKSSELKRTITEALEQCPYIRHVESIETELDGGFLTVKVEVKSVYEEGWVEVSVEI